MMAFFPAWIEQARLTRRMAGGGDADNLVWIPGLWSFGVRPGADDRRDGTGSEGPVGRLDLVLLDAECLRKGDKEPPSCGTGMTQRLLSAGLRFRCQNGSTTDIQATFQPGSRVESQTRLPLPVPDDGGYQSGACGSIRDCQAMLHQLPPHDTVGDWVPGKAGHLKRGGVEGGVSLLCLMFTSRPEVAAHTRFARRGKYSQYHFIFNFPRRKKINKKIKKI